MVHLGAEVFSSGTNVALEKEKLCVSVNGYLYQFSARSVVYIVSAGDVAVSPPGSKRGSLTPHCRRAGSGAGSVCLPLSPASIIFQAPLPEATFLEPHPGTVSMSETKANAEALVPKFKFERLLNQGSSPSPPPHLHPHQVLTYLSPQTKPDAEAPSSAPSIRSPPSSSSSAPPSPAPPTTSAPLPAACRPSRTSAPTTSTAGISPTADQSSPATPPATTPPSPTSRSTSSTPAPQSTSKSTASKASAS